MTTAMPGRRRYSENLVALRPAQKPTHGVPAYLRWFNRPLGRHVAAWADVLGLSPNQVTAVSAALSGAGLVVLVLSIAWWAGPVAAGLLLLGYVFDSADGQLARLQGSSGPAGEWLDHVVDGIRAPLVHVALAIHLTRTAAPSWIVVLALVFSVLVSAWFLSQLLAEKLSPVPPSAIADTAGQFGSWLRQPQDPSTTYAVIAICGLPLGFAIAYPALLTWQFVVFCGSLRRKYHLLRTARRS